MQYTQTKSNLSTYCGQYFMEAQEYTINKNLLCQDSKPIILLAKDGRISAGKTSRHIYDRFFLIPDKIENSGGRHGYGTPWNQGDVDRWQYQAPPSGDRV